MLLKPGTLVGVVAHASNASAGEAEVGESKFEASSCYMSLRKRKRHIVIDICMGYHGMI